VRLHEVENPLLEVIKHADLHCMEEVGLREVAHDTGNMSKLIESSVNMARREFGIVTGVTTLLNNILAKLYIYLSPYGRRSYSVF
jgi:hypothetical protein